MDSNRTYIDYLCEEIERQKGIRELYSDNYCIDAIRVDNLIQEYKGQYTILTGTPYEVKE